MYCPDQQSHLDRLTPVTPKKSRIKQHVNLPRPEASFRAERSQTSTLNHRPLLAPECDVARVTTVSVCLLASTAKEPTFCSRPRVCHSHRPVDGQLSKAALRKPPFGFPPKAVILSGSITVGGLPTEALDRKIPLYSSCTMRRAVEFLSQWSKILHIGGLRSKNVHRRHEFSPSGVGSGRSGSVSSGWLC